MGVGHDGPYGVWNPPYEPIFTSKSPLTLLLDRMKELSGANCMPHIIAMKDLDGPEGAYVIRRQSEEGAKDVPMVNLTSSFSYDSQTLAEAFGTIPWAEPFGCAPC